MMPSQQRSKTWSAVLHPWAVKLNLKPQLASIKLADILSGQTCKPISLSDLDGYLTFKEYSVQNLQFVIWYQDYRKRFLNATQRDTCDPADLKYLVPNRASEERRVAEGSVRFGAPPTSEQCDVNDEQRAQMQHDEPTSSRSAKFPPPALTPPSGEQAALNRSASIPKSQSPAPSVSSTESSPSLSSTRPPVDNELFHKECMRVIATFIKPDSPKELNLDAIIRETIIRDAVHDNHPDIFLHAYRDVYNLLETVSLPNFMTNAITNVNLQKQVYNYVITVILWLIGCAVALALIMLVHTRHHPHNRAWRFFSVPWIYVGMTTFFSALRGYCSMVAVRGNTQLRAWELEEHSDEEMTVFANISPKHEFQGAELSSFDAKMTHMEPESSQAISSQTGHYTTRDLAAITPFDAAESAPSKKQFIIAPFAEPFGDGRLSNVHAPFSDNPRAHRSLPRPKIFGPERPVEDPRIKALHMHMILEMHIVALIGSVVFSAIVFSVPNSYAR